MYYALPVSMPLKDTTVYDHAMKVLEDQFTLCVNIAAERYRFGQREQHAGESIDNYVAALRELGKTCNFGNMTEEMIRDHEVEKTNSSHIRERLLMEINLTLTLAIEVARCIENGLEEAKVLSGDP